MNIKKPNGFIDRGIDSITGLNHEKSVASIKHLNDFAHF